MSKITWDGTGERFYETGVDRGVLFKKNSNGAYGVGVGWNGITSVSESPSGAEPTALYADNIKYLNLLSNEEFACTIEAYMYPDEFAECDGTANPVTGVSFTQQARKAFGFSYRTKIGNDVDGDSKGYKIHLVYGCTAKPSEKQYSTVNDSPEANTFSWEVETVPVEVSGYKPTAHVIIDSTKVDATKLADFEKILYGVDAVAYDSSKTYNVGDYCTHTDATVTKTYKCKVASTTGEWDASKWDEVDAGPRLPLPSELITLFPEQQAAG